MRSPSPSPTLHDFIVTNRGQIIELAQRRVGRRGLPGKSAAKLENGIPLFLSQLVVALEPVADDVEADAADTLSTKKITDTAGLHGHELLRDGFTVGQVVHGYGDVCQAVTELAGKADASISSQDFQSFNRCLDDAIAGAVTAYGHQREDDLAYQGTERMGVLAHELRNLLNTAILSFDAIKSGRVGPGGSTGAIHSRSLARLSALVERSLAEVRMEAGVPAFERISVTAFIEEIAISAAMQAEGHGLGFTVDAIDSDVLVDADWQLLASAASNLLQNAFKFTRTGGGVVLAVRATTDRVLIDIRDECGGLPEGKAKAFFTPFERGDTNRSGLGLGLSIALSAVRANSGEIHVCDVPGKGCVFTIDLPRSRPPPA